MLANFRNQLTLALCLTLATAVGCGESSTPIAVKSTKPLVSKPTDVKKPVADAKKDAPKERVATVASYQPPFPNRQNPFQPPTTGPRRDTSKGRKNASVALIGFANVGEPKVVLAIDGLVSPLANGEEIAGVRVISITPPNAVLQRGRNRWTATIN